MPGRPSSHRTQAFLWSCPLLSCWGVLSQELLYFCGLNSTLRVVMLTKKADGTYPSLPPTFLSFLSSQVTLVWSYPVPSPQTYSQLLHTFTTAFGRAGTHTGLLCLRVKSTKIWIQAISQFLSVNTPVGPNLNEKCKGTCVQVCTCIIYTYIYILFLVLKIILHW